MTEIIVTKREDDYHASIRGHPEIWVIGDTYFSAIGDLVASHQDRFKVKKITMLSEKREVKRIIMNSNHVSPTPTSYPGFMGGKES